MALNLGFTGFRIGYDFYKSDWKYLNDATTRGKLGGVDGIIVPAGTMTVYDQVLGQNAQRPFITPSKYVNGFEFECFTGNIYLNGVLLPLKINILVFPSNSGNTDSYPLFLLRVVVLLFAILLKLN